MKLSFHKILFKLLCEAGRVKSFAIILAILFAFVAHVCEVVAKQPASDNSRPNVLFIAIDDMRLDGLFRGRTSEDA